MGRLYNSGIYLSKLWISHHHKNNTHVYVYPTPVMYVLLIILIDQFDYHDNTGGARWHFRNANTYLNTPNKRALNILFIGDVVGVNGMHGDVYTIGMSWSGAQFRINYNLCPDVVLLLLWFLWKSCYTVRIIIKSRCWSDMTTLEELKQTTSWSLQGDIKVSEMPREWLNHLCSDLFCSSWTIFKHFLLI